MQASLIIFLIFLAVLIILLCLYFFTYIFSTPSVSSRNQRVIQVTAPSNNLAIERCNVDTHCPEGKICISGKCISGCRNNNQCNGSICFENRCVDCSNDDHCGSNQRCENNKCVASNQSLLVCKKHDDCDTDSQCVNT